MVEECTRRNGNFKTTLRTGHVATYAKQEQPRTPRALWTERARTKSYHGNVCYDRFLGWKHDRKFVKAGSLVHVIAIGADRGDVRQSAIASQKAS